MYKRDGGLMLCRCGHTRAFHFARPLWYGGPMDDKAPCAHCHCDPDSKDDCQGYVQGDFQGFDWRQRCDD